MAGISAKGTKLYMWEMEGTAKAEDIVPNVVSISDVGGEVDEVEVTDLDSGEYKEFIATYKDGGSIDVVINLVTPEKAEKFKEAFDDSAYRMFGIAYPTVLAPMSVQFTGFIKSYKVTGISSDGTLQASCSIRVSGKFTTFTKPIAH